MDQKPDATEENAQRVLKAQADAAVAKAKAEQMASEQKMRDQKAKNRNKKISSIKKMSKTVKTIIAVAIVVVIVGAAATIPGLVNSKRQGITVSEAALKEAVNISKLSTAEFVYNGIAEKKDDNDRISYYIYYEATAKSGINMDDIDFQIDPESKLITVILPSIAVENPVIDESKLEYLPENASVELREVIEVCKNDAQHELEANANIRRTAEDNLRATLEALLMPIVGGEGYQLEWSSQQDTNEGATNETSE